MNPAERAKVENDIKGIFSTAFSAGHGLDSNLTAVAAAKLYEMRVLAELVDELARQGFDFHVVNGLAGLKASPGPINGTYAHIKILRAGRLVGILWTDVEFVGVSSYELENLSSPQNSGEYHELDIAICDPGVLNRRPNSREVFVAVECKHWAAIPKKLLREALGVRRELSFLRTSLRPVHPFSSAASKCDPCVRFIFAYSIDSAPSSLMQKWAVPAKHHEVELRHIPVK